MAWQTTIASLGDGYTLRIATGDGWIYYRDVEVHVDDTGRAPLYTITGIDTRTGERAVAWENVQGHHWATLVNDDEIPEEGT